MEMAARFACEVTCDADCTLIQVGIGGNGEQCENGGFPYYTGYQTSSGFQNSGLKLVPLPLAVQRTAAHHICGAACFGCLSFPKALRAGARHVLLSYRCVVLHRQQDGQYCNSVARVRARASLAAAPRRAPVPSLHVD